MMKAVARAAEPNDREHRIEQIRPLYLEALTLVERLHRRLLDVIKDEFDRRSRADKRSVRVKLTPKGQAIRERIDALYNRQLQSVEQVVGLTIEEFDRLNKALTRLERFWTDQILYRL